MQISPLSKFSKQKKQQNKIETNSNQNPYENGVIEFVIIQSCNQYANIHNFRMTFFKWMYVNFVRHQWIILIFLGVHTNKTNVLQSEG